MPRGRNAGRCPEAVTCWGNSRELTPTLPPVENSSPFPHASRAALSIARQPRTHLFAFYQGWIDTLTAWQVAGLTGRFETEVSSQRTDLCRQALCAQALREKQLARRVVLNTELQACRCDLDTRMQILRAENQHE